MKDSTPKSGSKLNGIDLDALDEIIGEIDSDPAKARVEFRVRSAWTGQARSETMVDSYTFGGARVARSFKIAVDEPFELLGENTAPSPQEMLMAAFNACIMVGYVAGASVRGVTLEKVEIETNGELDLRGFLGLSDTVKPGPERIAYTVRIKGDGTPEQFQAIHEAVMKTSPTYFNVSRPIAIDAKLEVQR
jgi:uncharacterized OsmC-like protein